MDYVETYNDLCHGTDSDTGREICNKGFKLSGDNSSWCGKGAYFYDIKAKAWWAAKRKCQQIKEKKSIKVSPTVIFADIKDLHKKEIFDLRVKKDLENFQKYTEEILSNDKKISIENIKDDEERIIKLRSLLISFYAKEQKKKLVIGNFKQRYQPALDQVIEFSNSLNLVFGIETIYCVKDNRIISNIRMGGKKSE